MFQEAMINGKFIMNFVEEQEELSLYIWAPWKLYVRRRQRGWQVRSWWWWWRVTTRSEGRSGKWQIRTASKSAFRIFEEFVVCWPPQLLTLKASKQQQQDKQSETGAALSVSLSVRRPAPGPAKPR